MQAEGEKRKGLWQEHAWGAGRAARRRVAGAAMSQGRAADEFRDIVRSQVMQ